MDFDNQVKHWIKDVPYVWTRGDSFSTSTRRYLITSSSAIFQVKDDTLDGGATSLDRVKYFPERTLFSVINIPKTCNIPFMVNYFLVYKGKNIKGEIRINGVVVKETLNIERVSLSTQVNVDGFMVWIYPNPYSFWQSRVTTTGSTDTVTFASIVSGLEIAGNDIIKLYQETRSGQGFYKFLPSTNLDIAGLEAKILAGELPKFYPLTIATRKVTFAQEPKIQGIPKKDISRSGYKSINSLVQEKCRGKNLYYFTDILKNPNPTVQEKIYAQECIGLLTLQKFESEARKCQDSLGAKYLLYSADDYGRAYENGYVMIENKKHQLTQKEKGQARTCMLYLQAEDDLHGGVLEKPPKKMFSTKKEVTEGERAKYKEKREKGELKVYTKELCKKTFGKNPDFEKLMSETIDSDKLRDIYACKNLLEEEI